MEEMTIFDFLPSEQAEKYKPKKSTDWKWSFKDYPKKKNGLKVFSCFACGGGSTMGYKLAGCEVLGCVEIDPKMNEVYVKNHHPKYNFCMDLRDFNALPNGKIPKELFDIDILDGSPPCTTFSIAGDREESWGKKKKFREGQKEQTLDDLSFVFIATVRLLHPKVVIMENVEGLLLGEAFSYVQEIYRQFKEAGYAVHHWLLKGEKMGVPQKRHRVFFVAIRSDLWIDPAEIDMSFDYEPVTYGEIKSGVDGNLSDKIKTVFNAVVPKEKDMVAAWNRIYNPGKPQKRMWFNSIVTYDDDVIQTISGDHGQIFDYEEKARVSDQSVSNACTFPQEYDFCGKRIPYICGMSVPPVMMKRVVQRLIEQGVFSYATKPV